MLILFLHSSSIVGIHYLPLQEKEHLAGWLDALI